jgi:hypothetical protein
MSSFSAALPFSLAAFSDPLPPELTYRPLPTLPFSRVAYSGRGEVDVVVVVVAGEPRHGRRRVSNWNRRWHRHAMQQGPGDARRIASNIAKLPELLDSLLADI